MSYGSSGPGSSYMYIYGIMAEPFALSAQAEPPYLRKYGKPIKPGKFVCPAMAVHSSIRTHL